MGIGLSGTIGAGDTDADALLDADFGRRLFRLRGTSMADQAAFLAAVGGSLAPGGRVVVGPYLPPVGPELLANGDFAAGIGDWLTNGAPLSVVDGALQATGIGGNTTTAYLPINSIVAASGRAYRLRGKVRRGSAGSVHLGIGAPLGTNGYAGTNSIISTVPTEVMLYCGGFHASNAAIAVRNNSNPSNGTFYADDLSLREVYPLAGFLAGQLCGSIEAVAPETAGAAHILFQADDNADYNNAPLERNYIRLVWDADGHLRFVASFGGTGAAVEQANLDLGPVAAGAPFAVAFSARANDFRAALLGQPVRSDLSGAFPGLAALRFGKGRSDVDKVWTGTIGRLRLYRRALSATEFLSLAAGNGIVAWGDSLTAGSGASDSATRSFPAMAQTLFDPPRAVVKQGVGGQTSTQIAARMNALPILVSVSGDAIPASGGVAVTGKSINILGSAPAFSGSQSGWLGGVKGSMSTDAAGNWTFTRSDPGAAVPLPPGSPFRCELGEVLRPRIAWLWMGRNGADSGHDVINDIAAAVASLGHRRFLVGSVLVATDPEDPETLNARLGALYGPRFVNVLAALIAAHDGSPQDLADIATGYVPASLRSGDVHLNDAGYSVVAEAFCARTLAMGW
ncbi:MAG: hypothetical protein ABS76_22360 [Pelagibacterium sp. SCN 64-44]|nr:MAG: hypothetical protein ABS76_22360 [Pelagibacterium sp. SCN 64-44]